MLVKSALVFILILSVVLTYVLWFTNTIDDLILSNMVLINNTNGFDMWKDPNCKVLYKVHIFNYTNIDDYRNKKAKKLHVEDIGPYTYEENLTRIDVSFGENNKLSYREKRILTFKPDLSKGLENDSVQVPNIPLISAGPFIKDQNYFIRLALSSLLRGINEEPFITKTVGSFLTGYRSSITDVGKTFILPDIPEKTGILVTRMDATRYKLTINTGEKDINRLGILEEFNGENQFHSPYNHNCSSVESSTGSFYPINRVKLKLPLNYIFPEACRRMPLVFSKETTVLDGVLAYQYISPSDKLNYSSNHTENLCYCKSNPTQCPPNGVVDISMCNFGSPVFLSAPHFHRGDPSLTEKFEGLHPERTTYDSIFNIHPRLGFIMTIRELYQLNIQVQKSEGLSQYDMFEDGMILPIVWAEAIIDDETTTPEIKRLIHLLSFTVPLIEQLLKYGCLLSVIVCLGCFIVTTIKDNSSKKALSYRLMLIGNKYTKTNC
ncbi:scavenger receptor class B member 1-like [Diorhabda sublineata]|uniref:scavenger receptor class B member 1-like n=1 Tax=Diorhabda sublineata TaxID=1163346 RepID=UPI0024E12765|nr:scavenger receptor class B member 1-like [Diorhabda sublineata]